MFLNNRYKTLSFRESCVFIKSETINTDHLATITLTIKNNNSNYQNLHMQHDWQM